MATAGDDPDAVGTESHRCHLFAPFRYDLNPFLMVYDVRLVGRRLADGLSSGCVPEPDGAVDTVGGDAGAVGAEHDRVHRLKPRALGHRLSDGLTGRHIPKPDAVVTAAGDPSAVGAERHRFQPVRKVRVHAHRLADGLTGRHIPEPDAVVTAGGDPSAVGAERHSEYGR